MESRRLSVTYWREGRSKAISTEYFDLGKLPDCPQGVRPVLACQLFAVLGGFVISTYSLPSSSSSVGLWKNSIQVIILSSEMWKLSWEGCEFLTASRLSSSSLGTSRKWTSLLAPTRFARSR